MDTKNDEGVTTQNGLSVELGEILEEAIPE